VPANVALDISVLDARGPSSQRRARQPPHQLVQVMPGETLTCNGCHNPSTNPPRAHGRAGLTASINTGAPATGSPFPGTNAALFADAGETMAEVRNRVMCGGACKPSVDLAFQDYWPATPATTPSSTPATRPVRPRCSRMQPIRAKRRLLERAQGHAAAGQPSCSSNWTSLCRITIHYEMHIHPLWSAARSVDTTTRAPDLDPARCADQSQVRTAAISRSTPRTWWPCRRATST
jgi:hypothetical protein